MTDSSVLDRTMRKIVKAFDQYEAAEEKLDEPDKFEPDTLFLETVREIVQLALIEGSQFTLRTVQSDIRELLAELREMKGDT